jgi:guanosine-3',5'-bis(diphosphate) 3'-pyrophosphohydrolase
MNPSFNLDLILDATIFAVLKHHGLVRKDENASPYITHPLAVAREIYTTGQVNDQHILIAAILHDTIEDTPTTADEIRSQFGEEVLAIVLEVTDDKSLEKQRRKWLQVIHAPQLSHPARIIKLGDKIVNCRDILNTPPKNWNLTRRQEYIQWAADVIFQVRGANTALENTFDSLLSEAEASLNFHLRPFSSVHERPYAPREGKSSP